VGGEPGGRSGVALDEFRRTGADFVSINAAGLAMTLAATEALRRARGRSSVFLYLAFVLTQQALFNTIFHVGATMAYREYSPGLLTAVAGFLPAWWRLTRLARAEELISTRGNRSATAIGGAVHAVAVVKTVYRR
jgi:Protein of unknown function with HXXEE motif